MRILYIGTMRHGGTSLERMRALEDMGNSLTAFDVDPYYLRGNRIVRAFSHRALFGPAIDALNRDAMALGRSAAFDWVWIDKGTWVRPETLRELKRGGRTLIHYTPDPAILFHRTRHFTRSIPVYDVIVTNKRYELDLYREFGARHVLFSHTAFSKRVFGQVRTLSAEDHRRYDAGLVFVGHCEPHYVRTIGAAARATDDIAIWGRWERGVRFRPGLRKFWRSPGVWDSEYVKALRCAKIGLGLLTRLAPDRATTRSMEIPAAGTFLLAERTEEHQELFTEGKEAEFFDGYDEMQDKIRYFLQHDSQRQQIAHAGHARVMGSGYAYEDRIREIVHSIL